VAAVVVLFLPVLLAGMALVIDCGALLAARAQMVAAADMGALAGVQDLDFDLLACGRIFIREAAAIAAAEAWVTGNLSGRAFIEPGTVRVVVTVLNTDGTGSDGRGDARRLLVCPVTGRAFSEASVCVFVQARARLPFIPSRLGPVVRVHADAAVMGRPSTPPSGDWPRHSSSQVTAHLLWAPERSAEPACPVDPAAAARCGIMRA
jgi:hypothetical protein